MTTRRSIRMRRRWSTNSTLCRGSSVPGTPRLTAGAAITAESNPGKTRRPTSDDDDDDDDDEGAKNYRLSPWMQARVDAEEAFMEAKGRGMTPRQGGAINPGSGDEGSTTLLSGTDLTAADDDLSNGDPAGPDDDRGGVAD